MVALEGHGDGKVLHGLMIRRALLHDHFARFAGFILSVTAVCATSGCRLIVDDLTQVRKLQMTYPEGVVKHSEDASYVVGPFFYA